MAKSFNLKTITSISFKQSILEMLGNPQYHRNAQLRSVNFQDQKEHPLNRAMWWIEYVLRNPDISFLKQSGQNLHFAQNIFVQHSIDVITFLLVVVLITLLLTWKTVQLTLRYQRVRGLVRQEKEKRQ